MLFIRHAYQGNGMNERWQLRDGKRRKNIAGQQQKSLIQKEILPFACLADFHLFLITVDTSRSNSTQSQSIRSGIMWHFTVFAKRSLRL